MPLGLVGILLFIGQTQAHAQSPNNAGSSGQIPQDRLQPVETIQDFRNPGTIPSLSDILKNFHGSYALSFMGPRLTGATDETYNIYLPDKSSVQLYHTVKLGYQVSRDLQIGVDEAIVNNVASDVQGFPFDAYGAPITPNTYGKTFEWYDPNIYFDLPNLVSVPGWSVFTSASFSLPLTSGSINIKRITQFIIQQSWTKDHPDSKWSYGFHLYLNPQFYTDPIPDGFTTRETFSFSFGPSVSYQVSNLMTVGASQTYDIEHDSPDAQGFFHFGPGLPDYTQLKFKIFPDVYPLLLSFGGYFQFITWNPSWDTAIVGANFSIGF